MTQVVGRLKTSTRFPRFPLPLRPESMVIDGSSSEVKRRTYIPPPPQNTNGRKCVKYSSLLIRIHWYLSRPHLGDDVVAVRVWDGDTATRIYIVGSFQPLPIVYFLPYKNSFSGSYNYYLMLFCTGSPVSNVDGTPSSSDRSSWSIHDIIMDNSQSLTPLCTSG